MRCTKFKSDKCRGTITITNDYSQVLKEIRHTCVPDFTANDIAIKMDICKQQASSTNIPVAAIYNNALIEIEASGMNVAEVPLFKSVKSSLYGARKKFKIEKIDK